VQSLVNGTKVRKQMPQRRWTLFCYDHSVKRYVLNFHFTLFSDLSSSHSWETTEWQIVPQQAKDSTANLKKIKQRNTTKLKPGLVS